MARNNRKAGPSLVKVRALVGVRAELPDGSRVSVAAGEVAEVKSDVASRMVATGRARVVEEKEAEPDEGGGSGKSSRKSSGKSSGE